jgi:hypothetical protein
MVAFLLMKQQVHYFIDILAAPFAGWGAYSLGKFLTKNFRPGGSEH